jgi:hypothetical protein
MSAIETWVRRPAPPFDHVPLPFFPFDVPLAVESQRRGHSCSESWLIRRADDAAQATAAQAAQGITPERIQALMNPYTSNVVDEMGRLSQENVQRNLLPTMKAGFVGTGGLGGQRYANALGQSMSDIQAGLTGQQYGALSKG